MYQFIMDFYLKNKRWNMNLSKTIKIILIIISILILILGTILFFTNKTKNNTSQTFPVDVLGDFPPSDIC